MKENFDTLLERLVASTRSPRGRYSKEHTWPLLQATAGNGTMHAVAETYAPSAPEAFRADTYRQTGHATTISQPRRPPSPRMYATSRPIARRPSASVCTP